MIKKNIILFFIILIFNSFDLIAFGNLEINSAEKIHFLTVDEKKVASVKFVINNIKQYCFIKSVKTIKGKRNQVYEAKLISDLCNCFYKREYRIELDAEPVGFLLGTDEYNKALKAEVAFYRQLGFKIIGHNKIGDVIISPRMRYSPKG